MKMWKNKKACNLLKNIKIFIFDLDGTLYFKGKKFDKVDELIELLRAKNKILRFVTNTDSKSPTELLRKMKNYGIYCDEREIVSPINVFISFIKSNLDKKFYVMVSNDVENYLKNIFSYEINNIYFYNDFEIAMNEKIDFVAIGDISDRMNYDYLNKGFYFIYNGAEMLAFAKFFVFFDKNGVCLNTGAFVKMFEEVCKKEAVLLGKPSKLIIEEACKGLELNSKEIIIIGDDPNIDIKLAKNISAYSVLLKQGHFIEHKYNFKKLLKIKPTFIFDSIKEFYLFIKENI
ncbi:MAG: HAD-IIA family hydrolase [Spirochaetes bacterium]|nr:HAD-IIA family hydrolase [Spirochaetota bacterium]